MKNSAEKSIGGPCREDGLGLELREAKVIILLLSEHLKGGFLVPVSPSKNLICKMIDLDANYKKKNERRKPSG